MHIGKKLVIGGMLLLLSGAVLSGRYFLPPKNSLEVNDQVITKWFIIRKLTLSKPTFVVIVAANKYHQMGNVIVARHPRVFPAGTYRNVEVYKQDTRPRREERSALEETLLKGGENLYFVILYEDADRNGVLTDEDRMVNDWFGRPLIRRFVARPLL